MLLHKTVTSEVSLKPLNDLLQVEQDGRVIALFTLVDVFDMVGKAMIESLSDVKAGDKNLPPEKLALTMRVTGYLRGKSFRRDFMRKTRDDIPDLIKELTSLIEREKKGGKQ